MKKTIKSTAVIVCLFLCIYNVPHLVTSAAAPTNIELNLSNEERELIAHSQSGSPVRMAIIPHTFPLSDCPPNTSDFVGINMELLRQISELTGLCFSYYSIPVEEMTPYQMMQEGTVSLVAGTIKLDAFLNNPELILSDRLSDGSAICIAKQGTVPTKDARGKIAVMKGYQAGFEFAKELFPTYEVVPYPDNQKVMSAVREGSTDLALISRYVGIYQMQNPLNEDLVQLTTYKMENDSCVMGINTPENQLIISIINQALAVIGVDGYNYTQMNFSLSNPYKLTFWEWLYKYRYLIVLTGTALITFSVLVVRLKYTQKEHKKLSFDSLTGALTEAGFELAARNVLSKISQPLFITDFDVHLFSIYNELNGKAEGDVLLKNIVKIAKEHLCEQDIICRAYADHFKVLSTNESLDALTADIRGAVEDFNKAAQNTISFNFGIYAIKDKTIPISKMLDFAAIAKKHIKEDSNTFICVFDESLHNRYMNDALMLSSFQNSVANKKFTAYYQPKFDVADKTVVGAEALVRLKKDDGTLVPPSEFIDLFEKSGQIQQLDFYMLEQACIFLKGLEEKGIPMLPIAVNFSRVHLYNENFANEVKQMVERYGIPKRFIEIECTETTMINDINLTREVFTELQKQGYSIAMDDFGNAYSSLNTLYSIPFDILKLDRGFLMTTLSHEKMKANIIISSVIGLAHDLSLRVVAEGVETEEQYQFLKKLDCDYIQGYYFSRPLNESQFLDLLIR